MTNEKTSGTILIVDDNRLNRLKLARILQNQGHNTLEAENGRQALDLIQREHICLMLLDIIMPEMDGFQVLEYLQRENLLIDLPVIVVSAQDETESAVRCIEMGAEDYLSKPFDPILLDARINAALEKKRLRDQEQAYLQQLQYERRRLQEYTAELQARNEELDAFAHTTAHDLKNPLGAIIGYAELLEKYYAQNTDDRAGQYLSRIQQAGTRMNRIIDELLLLAGIRHQQVEISCLDMTAIIHEALQRLDYHIQTSSAEIIMTDDFPTALGYAPWVEEIWANYISNAVKYGGAPPRLEIGGNLQADGLACFWVHDNGAGISEHDRDKLFKPFERLNRADPNGHGLGLSVVQRIVKKLGGTVGIESEIGQGSTFFFTLPQPN